MKFAPINWLKTGIVILCLMFPSYAWAENVDMSIVYQIESSNNPKAYNKESHARGLGQITPIVLEEWNQYCEPEYVISELFNPDINKKISTWYMNKRIPQMLRHFGFADTVDNRITAYNAGISFISARMKPQETWRYIKEYHEIQEGKK